MNPSGFYVDPKSPLKYAVEQSAPKADNGKKNEYIFLHSAFFE